MPGYRPLLLLATVACWLTTSSEAARVRFINAAPNLPGDALGIQLDNGTIIDALRTGEISAYYPVHPGSSTVSVSFGKGLELFEQNLVIDGNGSFTLVFSSRYVSSNSGPLQPVQTELIFSTVLLTDLSNDQVSPAVRLANFDSAHQTVALDLAGRPVFGSTGYRGVTGYAVVDSGPQELLVLDVTTAVGKSVQATLVPGQAYTVYVLPQANGHTLSARLVVDGELASFVQQPSPIATGLPQGLIPFPNAAAGSNVANQTSPAPANATSEALPMPVTTAPVNGTTTSAVSNTSTTSAVSNTSTTTLAIGTTGAGFPATTAAATSRSFRPTTTGPPGSTTRPVASSTTGKGPLLLPPPLHDGSTAAGVGDTTTQPTSGATGCKSSGAAAAAFAVAMLALL